MSKNNISEWDLPTLWKRLSTPDGIGSERKKEALQELLNHYIVGSSSMEKNGEDNWQCSACGGITDQNPLWWTYCAMCGSELL